MGLINPIMEYGVKEEFDVYQSNGLEHRLLFFVSEKIALKLLTRTRHWTNSFYIKPPISIHTPYTISNSWCYNILLDRYLFLQGVWTISSSNSKSPQAWRTTVILLSPVKKTIKVKLHHWFYQAHSQAHYLLQTLDPHLLGLTSGLMWLSPNFHGLILA